MTSYKFRKSAFEKEKLFSLEPGALKITDANGSVVTVPYENISSIRLSYMPGRMRSNNYQCNIESSKGNFYLLSSSYISLANFKSDNEGYRIFVRELIAKVAAANPTVALVTGRPKTAYRLSIILMIVGFFAIAFTLYYLGDFMSSVSWAKFLLLLLLIPMAFSYIMKNKPGVFSADNIPAKLLPA